MTATARGSRRQPGKTGIGVAAAFSRNELMHEAYQEHLIDASDVCSNCFRRIRVERVDPTRSGMTVEYESHMARHERHTEIAFGPAQSVTDQKGTFCTHCGTESAFERVWDDLDFADPELPLGYDRFKKLCQNAMRSLETKGVDIDRHSFATTAVSRFRNHRPIDVCLGEATEHAIVSAAMSTANERDHRVRAD